MTTDDFQGQLRDLAEKRRRQAEERKRQAEAQSAAIQTPEGRIASFHALERETGAHPSQANTTINARDTAAPDLGWNDQTVTGMEALNGAKSSTPTRHEAGLVPGRVSSQLPEYAQKELLARIARARGEAGESPRTPAAAPKPTRMPMAELSYLRGNPQVTQEMRPAAQAATNNARAARNVGAVIAPSLARPAPPRPTMTMMEKPSPGASQAPPPVAPPPQGPNIDAQVERLVNAGMDPAEARRIVERQTQVSGPMPAGLWAQNNSPEGIRDLKARIAGLKATEARQAGFEADFNEATGAPAAPPQAVAGAGRRFGGAAAAAAERWEQRGEQMADRRRFEEQIAAKEKERRDAMDPAVREQMDSDRQRKLELNRLYQQYKKDILAHERDEVDFASYAKNNGFDGDFSPGEADRYVGRSNTDVEKAALGRQRQAVVMQNSMERAGNGHILPQRTLDNPDSTPNMRRAAYMTLSRVNPHMADEYLRLAELESGEINAKTQAQAAADLARFNNPVKPEPVQADPTQVLDDVLAGAPDGANYDTIVTHAMASMPGETDEERLGNAQNYVQARVWDTAQRGPLTEGSWMYGHMLGIIHPLAEDGRGRSEKPITFDQFRVLAAGHGVRPQQALAIYNHMTGKGVPNNHAPVGAPDTDVAAVE